MLLANELVVKMNKRLHNNTFITTSFFYHIFPFVVVIDSFFLSFFLRHYFYLSLSSLLFLSLSKQKQHQNVTAQQFCMEIIGVITVLCVSYTRDTSGGAACGEMVRLLQKKKVSGLFIVYLKI